MSIVAAFLVLTCAVFAEPETVTLGRIDLRLGMSKAEVKARVCAAQPPLCRTPEAVAFWDNDLFMLPDLDSKRMLGNLHFSHGVLVGISKSWASERDQTALAYLRILADLIAEHNRQGYTVATVTSRSVRQPGIGGEVVTVSFGRGKGLTLSTTQGEIMGHSVAGAELYEEFYVTPLERVRSK